MKKIVYTAASGRVCIVTPCRLSEVEDENIARVLVHDVPKDAANVRVVDAADIPSDRTFRNALKADLTIDLAMARQIQADRLGVDVSTISNAATIEELKAIAP